MRLQLPRRLLLALLAVTPITPGLAARPACNAWVAPIQQKMGSIVAHHLKQVVKYLDRTDKAIETKNTRSARTDLEQAETQWKTFHDWNKGKFDPKDPAVLAVEKRMEQARKNVAILTGKTPTEPTPTSESKKPKMSLIVSRHLEKVERMAKDIDAAVARKDVKEAQDTLRFAQQQWKAFREWNKGKYDPNDERVLAAASHMKSVLAKVAALTEAAGSMTKTLSIVLNVILENEKQLRAATKIANDSLMTFDSNAREYRHLVRAREQLRILPNQMAAVNDRLLDSVIVCREFRKQIPSMDDLRKLVRDGYMAESSLKRVEAAPKAWLTRISRTTKESLDSAEENIANYEKKLQGIEKLQQAQKEYIANNAFEWGVDHADAMLQIVPAAFLELSAEGKAAFPDYVKARSAFVARANALELRSKKIAVEIGKVRKQIVDAEARRIDAARLPKTEYSGKKWKDAKEAIRKSLADMTRDKKLLRISIDSPWAVRKEARWRNQTWIIGTYRYISAYCVARTGSGKCYVYHMSFRRTQQADGTWSQLEQWSVGHVYEIREKNLDK